MKPLTIERTKGQERELQERLSELADLNLRTVQKIEDGHINILLTTVIRIQAALGCRWHKLLKEKI